MTTSKIKRPFAWRATLIKILGGGLALVILGAGGLYAAVNQWPGLGAQGAEILRAVIGNEAVAALENIVFQIEDQLQQWRYQAGGVKPEGPWATPTPDSPAQQPAASAENEPAVTLPNSSSTPLPPLGSMAGEGQWAPYLQNGAGQTVAYRTFLQPDPVRPYATVALVAFDLKVVQLGFVLGTEEPQSTVKIRREGVIPANELLPGKILAAFNGGFKTEHGHFGVMVNKVTLLPLRKDLGTIAIYPDGQVKIGEWETEITSTPEAMVLRQNGPLLIHHGQINPHTADTAPEDWGYTVNGATATWRSALGISADGRVLYYAAGSSLVLPALGQALADAGIDQAVQLDINNYWVHFEIFRTDGTKLRTETLLEAMQRQSEQRYLHGFTRDFFYVTNR